MSDEDGAIVVMVGLLLVVLLGLGALVIDVGNLYYERRQLQNGADAAALALAQQCVEGVLNCAADTAVLGAAAQPYADGNANDRRADVPQVVAHGLDPERCDPGGDSASNPLTAADVVKVSTSTIDANNADAPFLSHALAPMFRIVDPEFSPRTTVSACAVASFGPPSGGSIFPLAFCRGKFDEVTTRGTAFGPPDDRIYYKTPGDEGDVDCDLAAEAGTNDTYSGGFGWLDVNDPFFKVLPGCRVEVDVGDWYPGGPGAGLPNNEPWVSCVDEVTKKIDEMDAEDPPPHDPSHEYEAEPLLIPIYDNHRGNGEGGEFRIVGFGALRPTGYRFSGWASYAPDDGPSEVCLGGDNRCVRGWFTEFVALDELRGGGAPYFGVSTVSLTN